MHFGHHGREDGFALIEVVVAAVVLILLLTGVGMQLVSEFGTIGNVRNEQAGEAVLTKALAEVRAMPFTTVRTGLSTTDTTLTNTPYIIRGATTTWTFNDSTEAGHGDGEVINKFTPPPTHSNPPAPFYPHVSTTKVNSVTFTVRAFPTQYKTGATTLTSVYRVTVIVTWVAPTHGTLVGQTVVYSKTSTCATLSSTKAPFSAPCIPNFTSSAFAGSGTIELSRLSTAITPIKGISFTTFSLELPGASETTALTQISTVTGTARASEATITPGSTADQLFSKSTTATNDLAQGSGTVQSTGTQTSSLTALTKGTANSNLITATPSYGDTVASLSTIIARTATHCENLSTVTQITTLPCARDTATQVRTATLVATLYGTHTDTGNNGLGALPLATVARTGTYANKVFSARYPGAVHTTCPTTATSGCLTSTASQGLGTVRLAGIPERFITDTKGPPGFSTTNYLLQLSGYRAHATAWAKSSTTHGSNSAKVTGGTLSYYTFSAHGYKPITLTGASQSITIPPVTAIDTKVPGGNVTLTIAASLTLGSISTSPLPTTATCIRSCTYRAIISPPLSGTITYTATQTVGGVPVVIAHFVMHVNLGRTVATASYQKAI